MKIAALTVDTDWVPEALMEEVVGTVIPSDIPATYFVTQSYKCLVNCEKAPHANYLHMADLGGALDSALKHCKGAVGHRAHSCVWSERLRALFRERGILYDSSVMMYLESGIRPFRLGARLWELPLYFMDFFHMEYCELSGLRPFDLALFPLEQEGLKIFDFHPIHLFLNTPSLANYAIAKPHYQDVDALRKFVYSGYGTRNLLVDLIRLLRKNEYEFVSLEGINKSLERGRSGFSG